MGSVLSRVSGTGSGVLAPRRVHGRTRFSDEGTRVTGICRVCRAGLGATSTVSFSSVLYGAMGLFRATPSVLSCCEGRFGCVVISRCRSAGGIRCGFMDLLTDGCNGVYIINSSSRDVCGFHNTAVRGVLSFRGAFGGTGVVHLRRGCEDARGVLGTTGRIVSGGAVHGNGAL